jgi:hypothetical protein
MMVTANTALILFEGAEFSCALCGARERGGHELGLRWSSSTAAVFYVALA